MGSREEAALFSSKTQRMQEEKTQEFLPRDLNADYEPGGEGTQLTGPATSPIKTGEGGPRATPFKCLT